MSPDGSAFHRACIDRWLIESQAYHKRECPMCKANPLADDPSTRLTSTTASTSESSSAAAPNDATEPGAEGHWPPPQPTATAAGEGDNEQQPPESPLQVEVVIELAEPSEPPATRVVDD